jgi:mono/diheme cytochrome c family protein
MFGLSSPGAWRALALAAPALAALLSGCEGHYPEALHYPSRTDLIVVDRPTREDIVHIDSIGRLDESIAKIGSPGLGGSTLDPNKLSPEDRRELQDALEKVFGTPASPKVAVPGAEGLKLDEGALAGGSEQYRWQCLHCHGLAGDGRGPTGPWVQPHPRDYRQGTFKFISSDRDIGPKLRKPRREDLLRTIEKGIEGTSMPSFNQLSPDVREQIVSYVIHLSLRGEVELEIMKKLIPPGDKSKLGASIEATVKLTAAYLVKLWLGSNTAPPNTPPAYPYSPAGVEAAAGELAKQEAELVARMASLPKLDQDAGTKRKDAEDAAAKGEAEKAKKLRAEADQLAKEAQAIRAALPALKKQAAESREEAKEKSALAKALKEGDHEAVGAMNLGSVVRGYKLFTDTKGSAACITCHKDFGRQVYFRYDDWGTLVRPANLTHPVYRGGRRPLDVYWRVSGGIPGSGMVPANLSAQGYWDLVNFVQALPYPQMLPGALEEKRYARFKGEHIVNIRDKIYVPDAPKKGGPAGAHH